MAISDYTSNINKIEKDEKNEKADLKLSPEASKAYTDAMSTFHDSMQSIRHEMDGLENIGNVGNLTSANTAKTALRDAVSGLSGVQITADQHTKYTDELTKAVKTAHDILMKSG